MIIDDKKSASPLVIFLVALLGAYGQTAIGILPVLEARIGPSAPYVCLGGLGVVSLLLVPLLKLTQSVSQRDEVVATESSRVLNGKLSLLWPGPFPSPVCSPFRRIWMIPANSLPSRRFPRQSDQQ